jgi:lysophospholipase L1-like esterase
MAQTHPPFWSEIQAFKLSDSLYPPKAQSILFVGSSSFTKWTDIQDYFPDYPILNRGFGGSSLPDLIRYAPDIILPYSPKQIIIYCGENDLAGSDTLSPKSLLNRFKILFRIIRNKYPKIPVAFISMKPSPSRLNILERLKKGNSLIQEFILHQKYTAFINIYPEMLDGQGKVRPELFLSDQLHMRPEGYAIWKQVILPYLVK